MSRPFLVVFTALAEADFKRLPNSVKESIESACDELCRNPRHASQVEKLKIMDGQYRKRVGEYRILFEIMDDAETIVIARIRHRKDAYRP